MASKIKSEAIPKPAASKVLSHAPIRNGQLAKGGADGLGGWSSATTSGMETDIPPRQVKLGNEIRLSNSGLEASITFIRNSAIGAITDLGSKRLSAV
jgi:hypothetical protein